MKTWHTATALLILTTVTRALLAGGIAPTHISLPSGPGSIEGLGRNFTASLASGTASYGVDIAVPPGAAAFSPKLSLDYDSAGGVSELGMGWHLGGVPSLRRRTENGLPKFDETDTFELAGLGIPCDLLEVATGVFRPQHESGTFVRIQRSADGQTWEARDKGGTTFRFGGAGFTETEGDHVATYLLREQLDVHGHKTSYTWDASSGHALLQHVVWNDFGANARNVIEFTYEDRPDVHVRFSAGIKQSLTKRLKLISVTHGGSLVRRYDLGYAVGVHSRLATVDMVGSDGSTRAPTLALTYAEPSFATDGQIVTMQSAPALSPSDPNIEISDMDGDGLPDLLVTQTGQFRTYANHDGLKWSAAADWTAGASPSVALSSVGVQLADLDGDGAIDLVVKSGLDSFRYYPGKDATSFSPPVAIAHAPNFTFEDPDVQLADMDGDRRIDVVITTEAGLAIGYNLDGKDWTEPAKIGVVDPRQVLRFSDSGHTQLCDVNGDRVEDFCYLTSGSLIYWLGRGRGRFEPAQRASGVPTFDPSSPWELHDLDGDGWVDLVHVGVTEVDVALAKEAGQFAASRSIKDTPERKSTTLVRFADMNGTGTTDVVWVDVSGSPGQSWRYLELFPKGRSGLLQQIENGLGRKTTVTYGAAALDAAAARDAGKPWRTRSNVAMSVVKQLEVDDSLGDPVLVTQYTYRDGGWDAVERTFAGFGGGIETQKGDAYTPTLLTDTTFDLGLVHRTLRGAVIASEIRDESGYVFSRSTATYVGKLLGTALDSRTIDYAFKHSEQVDQVEGADPSKARTVLTEWDQDDFGNTIAERRWGEVVKDDKLAGQDESITIRTFANNVEDWLLGRVATEEVQDTSGQRLAARRLYYDGAPFMGLPVGQVSRGDVSRREEWIGPAEDAWELDVATAYDKDGNPIETKDARDGGRIFTWDSDDHTTLQSETVKLKSDSLTELANIDPSFGNLVRVTGYDGQDTKFAYDPLGRVTDVYRPGDPDGMPSVKYTYEQAAPLSRVVTERRIASGHDTFERTEELFDGLGRKRGALTREDGGKWVLTDVSLLDGRGNARRTLQGRFVGDAEHATPPLQLNGPGVDAWRDAMGRTIHTRTELGIENKTAFEPFVTKSWDGAQADTTSLYEHTPTVEAHDGLGRLISRSQTLRAKTIAVAFTYDAGGRLLSRTDPEGHQATYGYDGRNRLLWVKDPDAGEHHMVYDATGNLTDTLRPDGKTHHVTFDLAGRVLTEDWDNDGKLEITNVWDKSPRNPHSLVYGGKLVSVRDQGGSIENEYDERGRVTVVHHTIDGATYDVGSQYDAQDREAVHVYPDGSSIRIRRNARGQLSGYGKAVDITYDGDGVELQRSFNTGVVQTTGYDGDRRVQESIVTRSNKDELLHLFWTYDGAGNIQDVFDKRAGVEPAVDRSEHYTFDNLYRLRSVEGTWGHAAWTFSDSGNLLKRESSLPALQALDIAYGHGAGPHAMTSFAGRTLRYDPRGRMQTDGDRTYEWNDDDQLTKVTTRGGNWVESGFNANSQRTLRVEHDTLGNEIRTHFIDPWSEVKDGRLVRYIVHSGQRIARLASKNASKQAPVATASEALEEVPPGPDAGPGATRMSRPPASMFGWLALGVAFIVSLGWLTGRVRRRPLMLAVFGAVVLAICSCGHGDVHSGRPGVAESVEELGDDDELLFNDQLGSLAEQASGAGKSTGSFAAYPFGLTRYDTSSQTRRYANTVRDVHVGLDSMGARFYAPDLGIWTSPDPLAIENPSRAVGADAAAANPYAYSNLEPIIARDEQGQWFHVVIGAGIGAAIGGGVEAYHQYKETGHVEDWGKVAEKSAVGAVAGTITALAGPQAGLATVVGLGAATGAGTGVAERLIDSGGKSAGTVQDAFADAAIGGVTAGVLHGAGKLIGPVVKRAGATLKRGLGMLKKASPCSCFSAGTLVLTSDGMKHGEEIAAGDLVLARDEVTGETAWKPVVGTIVNPGRQTFDLNVIAADGRTDTIDVTPDHPFWVDGRGWLEALELVPGDHLGTASDGLVTVLSRSGGESASAVYNFEVAGAHSYFVGAEGLWVHNSCDLLAKAAATGVQANRAAGNAFRDEIAQALRGSGREVQTEVYKATPFGKRFIDIEVSQGGQVLGGVETKLGGSRYTPAQRAKDAWLWLMNGYKVNVVRGP